MDEQLIAPKLSPNLEPRHRHRVLLYCLGAFFLIIIAGSTGYLVGIKNTTESPTSITNKKTTPSPTIFSSHMYSLPTPSSLISSVSQKDMRNWQIYQDPANSFSIEAPPTLQRFAIDAPAINLTGNIINDTNPTVVSPSTVLVWYVTDVTGKSIQSCSDTNEVYQKDLSQIQKGYKSVAIITGNVLGKKINGIEYLNLDTEPLTTVLDYPLCISNKQFEFNFVVSGDATDANSEMSTIIQMLSSFKVIQ